MTAVKLGAKLRRANLLYEVVAFDAELRRINLARMVHSERYNVYMRLLELCDPSTEIGKRASKLFTDLPPELSKDQLFYELAEAIWLPYNMLQLNGFTHIDYEKIEEQHLP